MLRVLREYWEHFKSLPLAQRQKLTTPWLVSPRSPAHYPRTHRVVRRRGLLDAYAWWSRRETVTQAAERRGLWWTQVSRALVREGLAVSRSERRDPAWWDEFIDKHVAPRVKRATTKTVDIRRAA